MNNKKEIEDEDEEEENKNINNIIKIVLKKSEDIKGKEEVKGFDFNNILNNNFQLDYDKLLQSYQYVGKKIENFLFYFSSTQVFKQVILVKQQKKLIKWYIK